MRSLARLKYSPYIKTREVGVGLVCKEREIYHVVCTVSIILLLF